MKRPPLDAPDGLNAIRSHPEPEEPGDLESAGRARGRPRKYAFPGEVNSSLPPRPAPKPRSSGKTIPHAERAARGILAAQFSLPKDMVTQIAELAAELACTKSEVIMRAVRELAERVARKKRTAF